jgi:hypothetical protein
MLKYQKRLINSKIIAGTICIFILILFSSGCVSDSIVPGIDPNPTVNPDNSTVSYIEVTASYSTIKVNQSQQLVVKGYNSDDEWVILDKSKVYSWGWTVQGQCYNCIKPFVELSPKRGSLTTTFTSGVAGIFYVVAYYQENAEDDCITDYTEIKVIK